MLFPIMIRYRLRPIDFRYKFIIKIRIIKFGMITQKCKFQRSNRLRIRYRFLFIFLLPPLLLLLIFLFLFRRERKLLHILCFIIRNNRRNFGGFLLFINKLKTHISHVVLWQGIIFYNILYVSVSMAIVKPIKDKINQNTNQKKNPHIYPRSFS